MIYHKKRFSEENTFQGNLWIASKSHDISNLTSCNKDLNESQDILTHSAG